MAISMHTNVTLTVKDMNAAVLSCRSSKRYISKAFPISIINIMYNRIKMPQEEFENQNVRDINYVISKKTSKHKYILEFNRWMIGARHALDRDYLKDFYFMIKDRDGIVKEYYKLSFHYSTDDVQEENKIKKDDLYKQTLQLFNDINDLSLFPKWSEDDQISLSVEITYNDQVPLHYEPPYYLGCEPEELNGMIKNFNAKNKKKYKFQNLNTGYHLLKFRLGSEKFLHNSKADNSSTCSVVDLCEDENVDSTERMYTAQEESSDVFMNNEAIALDTTKSVVSSPTEILSKFESNEQRTAEKPKNFQSHSTNNNTISSLTSIATPQEFATTEPAVWNLSSEAVIEHENNDETIIEKEKTAIKSFSSSFINQSLMNSSLTSIVSPDNVPMEQEETTFCICESSVTHEMLAMVTCVECKRLFHCACFGYLKQEELPEQFYCLKCGGSSSLPAEIENITTFRLRLLFAFCCLTKEVPHKIMREIPLCDQNMLWRHLEQLEIIVKKGEGYFINDDKIKEDCPLREIFRSRVDSMQFASTD